MTTNDLRMFTKKTIGLILVVVLLGLSQFDSRGGMAQSGGTLGYGSRVYGTISASTPVVTYSITGQAGDFLVTTALSWTGTLAAQLEMIAPNGVSLQHSTHNAFDGEPLGAQLAVVLPQAGAYILRISGGNGTLGDYLLTVIGRAAAPVTALTYGEPLMVTIPANSAAQFFTFDAEACPTTLVVSQPSAGEPFTFPYLVKVRDQRGQMVALLRGGERIEDWVTVEALSGRYEVEVRAAEPLLTGSLQLLVTCANDNPGCTPGTAEGDNAACAPCPPAEERIPGGGCPELHFAAVQEADAPNWVTVTWDAVAGADGYAVYVTGLIEGGGETYLTHAEWVPGDPLHFTWILPEEGYIGYTFTLQVLVDDAILCSTETGVALVPAPDDSQETFCSIRADREGVPVRVGPGTMRSIFTYLNPGIEYVVVGQAADDAGNPWWELDKTRFPGHEGVISLWVLQADVTQVGDCTQVPQTDIPEIVPIPEEPPPQGWGPCGSCSTCGHPANECVTSPEGVCLWDPATCQGSSGIPPGDGGQCYSVATAVDRGVCYGAISVVLDTAPNCQGTQYLPGTTVQAHVSVEDSKCRVLSWTGCGASGSGSSVSFVPPSSCTITAHMGY